MNGIFHCNQFKFEDAVHGYVNPVFFMQNNRIQNNAAGITLEDIKLKAQNRILLNMEKQQQHAACEIKTPVKPRAETGVGVNEGLQTSLKQLMVVLEPHLLSDDGSVRRNAMLLLGLVLTRCTSLPVSQPLAERIVGFCAQRLFDWFSVEGAMLVYLGLLEHHLPVVAAGNVEKRVLQQDKKCASSDSDTDKTTESDGACSTPCPRVILTSVLRHVHAPSFAQPIRKNTLQVLTLLLDAFPDHVRAVGRKVVPRIFCQVENEKDPRNLMISFPLIEKLLRDFSDLIGEESKDSGLCILKKKKVEDETTQCLDMIADVLLSYFPIRFKPVHSNVYNVTETDLQFRLARCFIANIALSSRLLDGFLDFLNDNLAPQQRENIHDAVEAICSCVEYYQNTQLAQSYTRPFFDVIKLAAWHTPCAELPLLASGFARILALASQCPKATSINHTLQPCVSVLLSPAENGVALSSQEFAAARCIVCASAKASPRLLLPIVTSLFSEDEKKHFLGRLLISLADLRKTQESAVAQTPETRVQKTSVDARNEMRSALQLWTRITTDLDVLKELTVIIRLHIAQHPLQLIHLMPQLNATLNILLDLACTYSVAFVVEYDCNKTAGGILLFESIVNLLLCVASFVRPENPDHEPNASNVCRRAVGFLGCALGFPLPAEAPPDFPHWAVCWQEALQRRFKNKVNELHAAFDPLLQITENGLIGSSRLLPRVVEDVLWDGVSSLLQSFVTNKDSAERHAGDTLSNFLLGTAVKLSAIWVFEGCPLLDDAKQYSKLLQTLFEVVFCSIDYANRQLNDFGSEALTQNAFVAQLCLTLNTLRERLMDSSVVLSVDILDCAMGFVARILSNHAILASISRVLAALACNVQLSRKASFDPTSLLGLFVDVITLIVQRSDALSTLLTFLHQLVEADTLIDSTEHRQLPAATLFVISILPRLFALNVLGRCPEAEGSLNKVLTLASDITCSSDSSRGEAQEFVVAGMRKMLSVFLVHGPAEYVTTIALRVTTASSEAESPRQLLNTAILRGHVAQSLIVRAAAHEDSDDSAFAEIQHLLIDLIKECQSSKKTHKLLPFSLFVPAIVLRSALSSDLYPMSPNHSLTPSVKVPCHLATFDDPARISTNAEPLLELKPCCTEQQPEATSASLTESQAQPIVVFLRTLRHVASQKESVGSQQRYFHVATKLLNAWDAVDASTERRSLAALIFTLLVRLPLPALVEMATTLKIDRNIARALLETLKDLPWGHPLLAPAASERTSVTEFFEFQAEIDRLSGDVILFLRSLLLESSKQHKQSPYIITPLSQKPSRGCPDALDITQHATLKYWRDALFDHVDVILASCLRQASKNSIPAVRHAALHCVYLIGAASKLYPNVPKFKWMVCEKLQLARNDSRYFIRRAAALCSNSWNIIG